MKKLNSIRTFDNYEDCLEKAKWKVQNYEENLSIYHLINLMLTLNMLPEWIKKDLETTQKSSDLWKLANEKLSLMKESKNYILEEKSIETDIDSQLIIVRLFSNHTKHNIKKESEPFKSIIMGARLPATFPVKFTFLKISSDIYVDTIVIFKKIVEFWDFHINQHRPNLTN